METLEYSQELQHYINHAHTIFNIKSPNRPTDSITVPKKRYLFNLIYLDKTEQDHICGLYLFMRKHPEISEVQIRKMVREHIKAFSPLHFLLNDVKDLIPSLQTEGFKATCSNIVKDRMLKCGTNHLY